MNYLRLKKRLLLESGVFAAAIAALAAGIFFLDGFSDDYQKDTQSWETKVNEVTATVGSIRDKYDKIQKNKPLYEKVVQLQSEDALDINQQVAKNRFNRFRDHYYLSNLHLNMAPVTEMADANYRRAAYMVVNSEVSVDFEGLSDEYAYSLLDAIQQELPGDSKITKLTLTREGKITDESLRVISESGIYPLIRCSLKFTWLGIKPVEPNDSNANAAKNK